jgi:histidine ammonia-lyase
MTQRIQLDGNSLTLGDVWLVAQGDGEVELASSARAKVAQRRHFVDEIVRRGDVVYGVTTGFGKLSEMSIPLDRLNELQINLVRSHAAGVGALLPEREVRAMMLLRANVIAKGFSGARAELIDLLTAMLNA